MGSYDTAQVCLNGHPTNDRVHRSPQFNKPHCPKCGARTITACEACGTAIQGDYDVEGVLVLGHTYHPPDYCYQCGAAFPWMAQRLELARELVDETDELSEDERQRFKEGLDAISRDTPRTEVAASRMKTTLDRLRGPTAAALQKVVTEVATEAAKKILLGGA